MNAFDLVVTVALGSTLSTIIVSKSVSLAEGLVALIVLVGWQYAIAWSSVRAQWIRRIVKSEPTLLYHSGEFLHSSLRNERVPEGEIRAAVRAEGIQEMHDVAAVVLETDGSFSVIAGPHAIRTNASALKDIEF